MAFKSILGYPGSVDQVLGVSHTGGSLEYKTISAGTGITVTATAGTITIAASSSGSGVAPIVNGGRVYTVSAQPTQDGGSGGNAFVYFGPCVSNQITLGGVLQTFSQIAITPPGTVGMYWVYVTSGSSTTVTGGTQAWTSVTVPGTTYISNGQLFADSAFTKLIVAAVYVATLSGSNAIVYDWTGHRGIFNFYNQIAKPVSANITTATWTSTSTTLAAANSNTTDGQGRIIVINPTTNYVSGNYNAGLFLNAFITASNSTVSDGATIAISNTTGTATTLASASGKSAVANASFNLACSYCGQLAIGVNTFSFYCAAVTAGTATFNGGSLQGMNGLWSC